MVDTELPDHVIDPDASKLRADLLRDILPTAQAV